MKVEVDWDRLAKALSSDNGFDCPHCGSHVDAHDSDNAQHIVSYWGEDLHDFSCDQCGEEFVVKEVVTRHFEAAKTADDFE